MNTTNIITACETGSETDPQKKEADNSATHQAVKDNIVAANSEPSFVQSDSAEFSEMSTVALPSLSAEEVSDERTINKTSSQPCSATVHSRSKPVIEIPTSAAHSSVWSGLEWSAHSVSFAVGQL